MGCFFSFFFEGNCGSGGMKDFMNESKLIDLLNGSDYVPTYEDKDGDWMLVGDVPWEWAPPSSITNNWTKVVHDLKPCMNDNWLEFPFPIAVCLSIRASVWGSWKDLRRLDLVSTHCHVMCSRLPFFFHGWPNWISFTFCFDRSIAAPRAVEKCKNRSWSTATPGCLGMLKSPLCSRSSPKREIRPAREGSSAEFGCFFFFFYHALFYSPFISLVFSSLSHLGLRRNYWKIS